MRKLISFCGSALLLLTPSMVWAQTNQMDAVMVKNGKIYVVVAVLAVILIGIFLYLLSMERKLKRLEKSEKH